MIVNFFSIHANRIPVDLFLQTFARGIVKVEDIPKFNMVVERLTHAVPPKLSTMMSARIRSVSVWMKTYGDSVINNATLIMDQISRSSSQSESSTRMSINESVQRLLLVGSQPGSWQ
ncbi:hypothetical protein GCK32_022427 [Trichostrongylus colubriformis]|uniref:Uncharacterized protein n=1 Tax=Trichostrongylus colubriformis TaxID=6319 RepID=A0AAN8FQE2_TRICO